MTMCIMLTSANFFGSQKAQEIKFCSRIQAETEQFSWCLHEINYDQWHAIAI